ncbi:MAG: hypothetical protein IKV83_00410 [Muribaculaceae bacterium]|nr:hypothetical protein [Muribaculaceae bacterium]
MSTKTIRLTESEIKYVIGESVRKILKETSSSFTDTFNQAKSFRTKYGGTYGFELRKNGRWKYGDIEFDPNMMVMSCMGVSIDVLPNMTISDAEEDLFEALLDAGYESDF